MGRSSRPKPARLAEKLRQIRAALGLSQNQMLRHFGLDEELFQGSISGYELGTREPPLAVLLQYARAANVFVDALIDDELSLPDDLPARIKSEGVKRSAAKPTRKRAAAPKRRPQ
jgi:transcriptional regulator with XRE-family HTH domain